MEVKPEVVVEVIPTGSEGRWLKTADGWQWNGPTLIRLKDPRKKLNGYWRSEVEATLILWDEQEGGPADQYEEDPEEPGTSEEVDSPDSVGSHDPDDASS